jgi:trafficking protein particle complex subunit 3
VLTYGTIVAQLCKDFDGDYVEVNKQLDKMGYNIGLRLIEDYLAKSNTMKRCANFRETAEMISKVCKQASVPRRCILEAWLGRV